MTCVRFITGHQHLPCTMSFSATTASRCPSPAEPLWPECLSVQLPAPTKHRPDQSSEEDIQV